MRAAGRVHDFRCAHKEAREQGILPGRRYRRKRIAEMKVAPHADEIRQLVLENFEAYGAKKRELGRISDTFLIQDGRYYGRSYRTEHLMAMWLIDVGVLQFYGADGTMLRTINLLHEMPVLKAAA
jgi:hypothetical protein